MLRLLTAATTFTGAQLCLRSFFTVYLVQKGGMDFATAGLAFSLSQAAGIVGQVSWAVLSDRLLSSHVVMAIVGGVIATAALLTALITPDWPVTAVLVVAILFGGSAAGFVPVVLAEVARRSPAGQVGALTSGASLFLFSGVLLGPLVFGFVLSVAGYAAAFVTLAGFALAASAAAAATPRSDRWAANDD
jgi:MFS family permease